MTPLTPLPPDGSPVLLATIHNPPPLHDEVLIGVRAVAHPAGTATDWRIFLVCTPEGAAPVPTTLESSSCSAGYGEFADGCGVLPFASGQKRIDVYACAPVAAEHPCSLAVQVETR